MGVAAGIGGGFAWRQRLCRSGIRYQPRFRARRDRGHLATVLNAQSFHHTDISGDHRLAEILGSRTLVALAALIRLFLAALAVILCSETHRLLAAVLVTRRNSS